MPNKVEKLADGNWLVEGELGEKFTGEVDKILPTMIEAQQNTKRAYQTEKQKREAAEQELAELKGKQTPPVVPVISDEETKIQSYLLDQQARALGLPNGLALKARLDQMGQITDKMANQAVAADFMNQCPDFPNTDPAIEALKGKMEAMGYDYTPQSMIAAHVLCLREDKYKPLSSEEQNQTWANNMVNAGRVPPPMLRSTSPDANHAPVDLQKEPLAEMRARLIREQLAGGQ